MCSLSDCSTPFVGGTAAAVPTAEGVRLLYRQRASRCKLAAARANRPTRPDFKLCEEQCGAALNSAAVRALHSAAMEAAAELNPETPRARFPGIVEQLGAGALLAVRTADLESMQLGLMLSISMPGCIRPGTAGPS